MALHFRIIDKQKKTFENLNLKTVDMNIHRKYIFHIVFRKEMQETIEDCKIVNF